MKILKYMLIVGICLEIAYLINVAIDQANNDGRDKLCILKILKIFTK